MIALVDSIARPILDLPHLQVALVENQSLVTASAQHVNALVSAHGEFPHGGAAVGKSPLMPANPDLSSQPEVVQALVKRVRSFAPKP